MRHFKNPEEDSVSDELDELVEDEPIDEGGNLILRADFLETGEDDDIVDADEIVDDSSDFIPTDDDSDWTESMSDSNGGEATNAGATGGAAKSKNSTAQDTDGDGLPSSSRSCEMAGNASLLDLKEDEEEDETVRAMIAAIKKPRSSPPEIKLEDFVTDICFHPDRDIIALATITGDVCLYQYANEGNTLLRTIEVHAKAIRDVEFTEDGADLLTCSKDKSIMVTDMETEKLHKFYESAHEDAINRLHVIDSHLFATGDDRGTVKLWDLRTKDAIFALKEVEDYISQILTNDAKKLLLVTSGDGYLTTLNIGARKLYVQSEPYEEEFTCMGTYRGDSKLIVGTSKGQLYTYNWGQFGFHSDMFPGIKSHINDMIPITDRIGCVAGEEGVIRACHIAPFRNLGVVGQHSMPIEKLDINSSGELIASASHDNDVRFWNVKYFEEFADIKYNEKHNTFKEKRHNLPSSKFSNASDFFADLA